jgi:Sulfotransferase domain
MTLQVIGAGLGRTGTLSLKLALEHLGFGPCYHMLEVFSAAEQRLPQWLDVVRGKPDWDAIFAGFKSSVDYPTCYFWREQAQKYPDAKVVLSTRDAPGWFTSVNNTIMSPGSVANMRSGPLAEFMEGTVLKDFGDRVHDRAFMEDYFQKWEASVIAECPPERLLVHRAGDGWEPLCAFLGVPVPAEPYPRVNTSEDMMNRHHKTAEEVSAASHDAEASAQGYIDAMKDKAFGA